MRSRDRAERAAQRVAEIDARLEFLRERRRRLAQVRAAEEADVAAARQAATKALAYAIEAHRHSAATHRQSAALHRERADRLTLRGLHELAAEQMRAAVEAEHAAQDADTAAAQAPRLWSTGFAAGGVRGRLNGDARASTSAAGDGGRVTGPASTGSRGP